MEQQQQPTIAIKRIVRMYDKSKHIKGKLLATVRGEEKPKKNNML